MKSLRGSIPQEDYCPFENLISLMWSGWYLLHYLSAKTLCFGKVLFSYSHKSSCAVVAARMREWNGGVLAISVSGLSKWWSTKFSFSFSQFHNMVVTAEAQSGHRGWSFCNDPELPWQPGNLPLLLRKLTPVTSAAEEDSFISKTPKARNAFHGDQQKERKGGNKMCQNQASELQKRRLPEKFLPRLDHQSCMNGKR